MPTHLGRSLQSWSISLAGTEAHYCFPPWSVCQEPAPMKCCPPQTNWFQQFKDIQVSLRKCRQTRKEFLCCKCCEEGKEKGFFLISVSLNPKSLFHSELSTWLHQPYPTGSWWSTRGVVWLRSRGDLSQTLRRPLKERKVQAPIWQFYIVCSVISIVQLWKVSWDWACCILHMFILQFLLEFCSHTKHSMMFPYYQLSQLRISV